MKVKMFPAGARTAAAASAVVVSLGLLGAVPGVAAHAQVNNGSSRVTVTINGARQGVFGGANPQITVLKYNYSVISPRDTTSGQAVGKRQYSPIVFQKQWDGAMVQINKALLTNENLRTVTFTFYDTNRKGSPDGSYQVILTNAQFVSIHQHVGDTLHDDTLNEQRLEDIGVTFQGITIQDGTNSSSDSFSAEAQRKPAAHSITRGKAVAAAAAAMRNKPPVASPARRPQPRRVAFVSGR